ncbi:Alpha-L-fucosidase [Planctomycetes bacterium CA13]|uniref:alpha-L-fucosidase n=1 Tax=Novipirellula herctigrandis TaxID=2527986 RepID=A0A5C5ZCR7_9BACT|nr:Alpha-L-fucosidase [Planctomycetes bacterium CA13]
MNRLSFALLCFLPIAVAFPSRVSAQSDVANSIANSIANNAANDAVLQDPVKYEPTWESLDSRKTPDWYPDAKFGIFIHWGLYSVPSFSPRGTYAEWYWHAKDGTPRKQAAAVGRSKAIQEFHKRVYGNDFEYKDFRPQFTCEMFDPDQWADVFKRCHAKYVVLTSKHHDGYCLWPSKEASDSFGMPWNSVESGPQRDLVGELTKSVRAADIKMGLYYSIWDWFNPYWPEKMQPYGNTELKDHDPARDKYIDEVMYPQFKQLVKDYQPALLFSDGDWWMDDDKWRTRPLLSWLYNNAPNKNEVVINDRWGQVRGKHGGYMTTEYGSGFDDPNVLWEENRGIGKSFGYNRVETYDDYNSGKLLVFMLVDIVSRGGNFLLDIGPTADGRIPVIMEDRLAQMGEWLDVNGEAIFGTRRWVTDAQWSDGERIKYSKQEFHQGKPDPILEMSIMPREGQSVKEFYFTRKDKTLYALSPKWPSGNSVTIKGLRASDATKVSLLGSQKPIPWEQSGSDIELDVSEFGINDLPLNYMFVFKFTECNAAE